MADLLGSLRQRKVTMLWFFYYLTAIILPVVFYKHIHITTLSAVPLFCMILSLFLAFFWHGNTEKEENYPMPNTETLTDTEYKALAKCCNMAHRLFVPLHVPLFLMFSNGVKFLSLLLFSKRILNSHAGLPTGKREAAICLFQKSRKQ